MSEQTDPYGIDPGREALLAAQGYTSAMEPVSTVAVRLHRMYGAYIVYNTSP